MKSKKYFNLSLFLLGITFLIIGFALIFMPDRVPVHYDFRGNIDKYGSKYTFLILPAFALVFWLILHFIASFFFKKESPNHNYLYLAASIANIIFILLETIFIVLSFTKEKAVSVENVIYKILNAGLGLFFIFIGNILPKITKNKFFGLRTTWSLYNDNTWNKSQRYGGFTLVAVGFLMVMATIFVPGIYNLIVTGLSLVFALTFSIFFSYKVYKEEKEKENLQNKTTSNQ